MSTATIVQGYVPPFAGAATALSSAIASGATSSGASQTSATTTAAIAYSTDGATDSSSFVEYFVVPYLDAHVLSPPSYRYA